MELKGCVCGARQYFFPCFKCGFNLTPTICRAFRDERHCRVGYQSIRDEFVDLLFKRYNTEERW